VEGKRGTVRRSGGDTGAPGVGPKAAHARPVVRPSRGMAVRGSLRRRYRLSYKTRFRGYEDEGPAMFYSSVLSDCPVAFVDRVVIKAPVSRLPMRPGYRHMFRTKLKGREYEYYLDLEHRIPDFVVHVGSFQAGQHLYITCPALPLRRSILSVFLDCLVKLAERGILDLGTPKSRRRRACAILRAFTLSELELRIDLNRRAGTKLMGQLGEYRDEKGHFKLSCYARRHEAGQQLKLYDKSEPVIRAEVVLYTKFFATKPLSAVLSTPRVTFTRWWPLALKKIEKVEKYGHKPKLSHLREAIAKWVPLVRRVRDLEIVDIADEMIRRGAEEKLF